MKPTLAEQDYSDLAPLSDAEITELSRQEPLNNAPQLPANEEAELCQ